MISRSLAAIAVVALLSAPIASAADGDVPTALFASEAEARGDFDTWLDELLSAVEASPDSPYTKACLLKIEALSSVAKDQATIEARLQPLLDRGVRDPELREAIQDTVAGRLRARGEYAEADAMGGNDGYVSRFAVIGPFGWAGADLVERRYGPESNDLDPSSSHEGRNGAVKWMELPQLGSSPWVEPYSQIRQGGVGVAYAMARVRSDAPRTVAFKAWCDDSFKILVNGVAVVSARRNRERVPSPVWCTAHLESGWNRVVVKVAGRDSFALKITDPATGEPVMDVEAGAPLMDEAAPRPSGDADERTYRTPVERAVAAADDGDAGSLAAAAVMLDNRGRDWDAYGMWERAGAAAMALQGAAQANLLTAHGRFLADFTDLPVVQRKLRAKARFNDALLAYPEHHSARLRLARYENEDDRPDKAVAALQAQLAEAPSAIGWMAAAEICKARGWEREAIDAAQNAVDIAPSHTAAIRFLLAYDERYGNHEAARARNEQLVKINAGDSRALGALVGNLRNLGKESEALALVESLIERWPASIGYRGQRASLLRNLGRHAESLAVYRELRKLVPQEESYARSIAQLLELQGQDADALTAYDETLELSGYQPNVWRAMMRLRREKEDHASPFEPNVEQILAELPSTEELQKKYPKAVAVTVLDHSVVKVHADGSASNIVHMVYKLLNEKGVAKYTDLPNSGELLEVRTILEDGTEFAPTGLRGRTYNMEGLEQGAIIQHRFLVHQRATPDGYDGGQFFLQDFDFRNEPNPVLLSRFVVLTPKDMELDPVPHNYEGEPEVREHGDHTATIWQTSDMPRIEWEQNMPEKEELVPFVDYSVVQDMEDANWQYLGGRNDSRSTPILDEALAGVVKAGMSDMQKIHAVYDFVNTEITGNSFGGAGGATGILLEKAGDRGELFEALIRAAGVPYRQARAMSWRGASLDLKTPTSNLFRRSFLLLEPGGADAIPFFMGSHHAPFGIVPDAFRGSFAWIADEDGGEIITLPTGGIDTNDTTEFTITIGDTRKGTRLKGTLWYRSNNGYGFKRRLEDMSQDDRKKFAEGQLSGYFASPTLESYSLPELETRGQPLRVDLEGTMKQYLTKQGDRFVASFGLPASNMTGRFVHRPTREFDLVLKTRDDNVDRYEIELGDAFEVAKLPDDHVVVSGLGTYSLTWRQRGDRIVVKREVHLQPARYSPAEYKRFVGWCQAIDDAEQRKLELRKIR